MRKTELVVQRRQIRTISCGQRSKVQRYPATKAKFIKLRITPTSYQFNFREGAPGVSPSRRPYLPGGISCSQYDLQYDWKNAVFHDEPPTLVVRSPGGYRRFKIEFRSLAVLRKLQHLVGRDGAKRSPPRRRGNRKNFKEQFITEKIEAHILAFRYERDPGNAQPSHRHIIRSSTMSYTSSSSFSSQTKEKKFGFFGVLEEGLFTGSNEWQSRPCRNRTPECACGKIAS